MTRIADLVTILTAPHLHAGATTEGTVYGIEEGLLQQLEESIGSSGSGTGGGGNDRAGLPVNLGALTLWEQIVKTANEHVRPMERQMPLKARIQFWEGRSTEPYEQAFLEQTLELWVDQIRECLDPTPRRPLPNVSCPECFVAVLPRILDGEHVLVPPIVLYPRTLTAECQHCEAVWQGRTALMRLGLHSHRDSA